jgi:hypothetical protein
MSRLSLLFALYYSMFSMMSPDFAIAETQSSINGKAAITRSFACSQQQELEPKQQQQPYASSLSSSPYVSSSSLSSSSSLFRIQSSSQQLQLLRLPFSIPRGGAVLEPKSADEVDALLIQAGSENKLVVIDFTATWYVYFLSSDFSRERERALH